MRAIGKILKNPVAVSLIISLLVFLIILGVRNSGSIELLELSAYDLFIQLQPKTAINSPRILLIGITEEDIHSQGRWPLTDATLARALEILIQHHPRVIGIDLYRDIPVPPGSEKLDAILTGNSHIITVMKFGDDKYHGIPAPDALKNTDRVSFNDVLIDPGGTVRRGLLFLDDG